MSDSGLTRLTQLTLAQRASAQLLDFINTQKLAPGDSLPSESQIAELLGVSRTVVREALQQLQGQGIIRMVNGKRAEVRPIDAEILQVYFRHALRTLDDSLLELMQVRRGLEMESVRLCALNRTADQLGELERILKAMEDTHDPIVYAEHDTELHLAIATYSGNVVLRQLLLALRDGLHDAAVLGLMRRRDQKELVDIQAFHNRIVQAIANRDAESAATAMAEHMDAALLRLSSAPSA